jgi:SWI/SNF-related matrix-associated actin-dependent regulator of chromatin subfamily A3
MDLSVIEDSDIVITTYNTLSGEFSDRKSILHKIGWYRVVLDEGLKSKSSSLRTNSNSIVAHIIRRHATIFHRACTDLHANSRWCLTGTPIQNKLEDIGALFAFIKAKPFDSLAVFRRYVQTPFEQNDEDAMEKVKERLVLLLDSLCLRRTKDVLNLPNLRQRIRELKFTHEEHKQYENTKKILVRIIKQRVGEFEKNSKFGLFQAHLQMRIMCNHGTYQQPFSWQRRSFRDEREAAVGAIGSSAEITCSGCQQPMPILGSNRIYNNFVEDCAHVLCSECLEETQNRFMGSQRPHCPICLIHSSAVPSLPQPTDRNGDIQMSDAPVASAKGEEDDDHYFRHDGYSTKMEHLLKDIKEGLHEAKRSVK